MTRTMLVTGAASGIGRAVATHFAGRGWFVGLADIDREALDRTCADIKTPHIALTLDVRDSAQWQEAVATFAKPSGGRLDVFFNNAGIAHAGAFGDIPLDAARDMIAINFTGAVLGIYACLPLLKSTPGAHLINVGSSAGLFGFPHLAVYSATKSALSTLSEILSIELAEHGIHVTALQPHFTKTPMLEAPFHTTRADPPTQEQRLNAVRRYDVARVVAAVEKAIEQKPRALRVGSQTRNIYWLNRLCPGLLRRIVLNRWQKSQQT